MRASKFIFISIFLLSGLAQGQRLGSVYKINDLINRIDQADTTYVVNFWALWCKPCIQELPAFDSLNAKSLNTETKVILVNIDFIESLEKVNEFLQKKNIFTQCVLLDEVDGNSYINKISESWSGAIPGTLLKKGDKKEFIEHKMSFSQLETELKQFAGK